VSRNFAKFFSPAGSDGNGAKTHKRTAKSVNHLVRTFKSAQSEDASPTLALRNDPYMNADLRLAKSLLLAHGFDQAAVAVGYD
jgi:hypothetical protein